MTLARRELVTAFGVASALAAAGSVSACSMPPEPAGGPLPGRFFSAIAGRRLEDAEKLLAPTARLSLFTMDEQSIYAGSKEIVGKVGNLFHSLGLGMIGDHREFAPGGMYWRQFGPWSLSDMVRPGVIDINSGCGEPNNFVLNVFVGMAPEEQNRIGSILLLQSARLTVEYRDPAVSG